ncbi:porin [Paraburkholderia sp. J63]|uniref:porin n=1 Tax=Paraburkholderia sp. J63 TaxID=2805434 RepID=UPI002ABE1A15|nr:porin [Paraburkholderia sp. J63]
MRNIRKLACIPLLACTAGAHAQSSVTLYGIIDEGVTYTNNQKGGSTWQVTQGNYAGSRWGFKGSEDLGGGTRAIFTLENGFNPSNGAALQAGRLFGRSAWVGLANETYGSLTFGRQYNSVEDYLTFEQAASNGALGAFANSVYDNDDLNNTYRSQNSVKYTSPTLRGLTVEGLYGFSNQPGAFAQNRTWSVGADYSNGPLRLDAAYAHLSAPGSTAGGAIASDNYYSTASSIIANVKDNRVFGAGGSWTFGPATLAVLYTNAQFDILTGGSLHFANYQINGRWLVTPAWQVAAGYIYTSQDSTSASYTNAHYHQLTLGTNYFLSKRTDVYLSAGIQRASGANAWFTNLGAPSSNNHQIVITAGLRNKF